MKNAACCVLVLALLLLAGSVPSARGQEPKAALSLEDAVRTALKRNPEILESRQQILRTQGLVVEVTAQALPRLTAGSSYSQRDRNLVEDFGGGFGGASATTQIDGSAAALGGTGTTGGSTTVTTPQTTQQTGLSGFSFQNKSWRIGLDARQLIYSGGQVSAAIKIARIEKRKSLLSLEDTIDQVIAAVRRQFYEVLLNRSLIDVAKESVELLEQELKDQKNRFEAGTVPRFNVLRAEVELANAQPPLIRSRNNYRIAQLKLSKLLGLDYERSEVNPMPFRVVGELWYEPRDRRLTDAIDMARERRPFLKLQYLTIRSEIQQIKVAMAGYQPRLEVTGGYEVRNSSLSEDLDDTLDGWFFGVQGSWDIFDGFETSGKVKQARARLETAQINYEDAIRKVDLEVQEAFSRLIEADEVIESQRKNVEQALESLRLARERLAAGAGTQLEVLDARVALTRARATEVEARFDYNTALAEFERVTAANTEYHKTVEDEQGLRIPLADPVPVVRGGRKRFGAPN